MTWRSILAAGVCPAFGCDSFWRRSRQPGDAPMTLRVVGRTADVDTVRYMYAYLTHEIERLADAAWSGRHRHAKNRESARAWKNAFRSGAAATIAHRLRASRADTINRARAVAHDNSATRDALVRLDRDADDVERHMAGLHLRSSPRAVMSSASGLHQGTVAGRNVNLGDNPGLGRPARQLGTG